MIGHSQDPMDLFDNIGLQSWMFIEKVRTHARTRARARLLSHVHGWAPAQSPPCLDIWLLC
eukprot:COSAG01_NODE_145_length_24103_cov_41.178012_12_plen_61_part_00